MWIVDRDERMERDIEYRHVLVMYLSCTRPRFEDATIDCRRQFWASSLPNLENMLHPFACLLVAARPLSFPSPSPLIPFYP